MTSRRFYLMVSLFTILWINSLAQKTENLFLITLDGLRWEELFGGADPQLITNPEYVKDTADLVSKFWDEDPLQRRQRLMPFFWNEVAEKGQIHGNRILGSKVDCSNIFWFSYPGYAEILCGKTNAQAIHSNAMVWNPDTTFLERLQSEPDYKDRIAAFCSWDVFPYIINEKRSNIPVNAAFEKVQDNPLSPREAFLNELLEEIPSPWPTVRLDAFTQHYALEYIEKHQPKVVYLAYGETDDFAHDGRYDHYLNSAHQTDEWISRIWNYIQQHQQYKDKTSLLITTDHGRGSFVDGAWMSHGKTYTGSNAIWYAVMGPDTEALGEVDSEEQSWQRQVAASCLRLLGLDTGSFADMAPPFKNLTNK